MPNLTEASVTTLAFVKDPSPATGSVPTRVFDVDVSATWCVGSVAHGGYLLCILTDAVIRHQRLVKSAHVDPAHLTSQFFSATVPGKAQVEIKVVSTTKRWTRLDVDLFQWSPDANTSAFTSPTEQRVLRIRSHYLVTTLPEHPEAGVLNYLARPCPLLEHPGAIEMSDGGDEVPAKLRFHEGMRWKVVDTIEASDGSLSWGCWIEMKGGEEVDKLATLVPFFADVAKNGPEMLPAGQRPGPSWYPTMSLSLDFKSKFPLSPSSRAQYGTRTFGLYSTTKSIHDGRHDLTVEVWAGPADLGARKPETREGEDDGDRVARWRREGARLVGVSTQMALAVPLEVNRSRAQRQQSNGSDSSGSEDKKARL
ncbi:thioesterase-like superfamily-domain-containing protein [Rhodotorula diobovata]|uniref:Thioesterase-like superfamily-domain-containing protein n=1 Tax=Rhodotorula diobovata TaxID=5288 RepID=A0A5C5G363_9BASI|nr:thioesterase-like superfamily-domain-containing protein [Rhodotorula diobovata]